MSHELRTPLTSILGISEILIEQIRGPLNEKQVQAIQWISKSGYHLLSLINDILDVSKIEAGKLHLHPDVISIQDVCEASLNFIQEAAIKKSITVDFDQDPSVTILKADSQRLKQILVNLLSNAVKFTPEKGNVSLEVFTNENRDQVRFVVSDTGIGIAASNLPKLFAPFSQVDSRLSRQYEGTGLGLVLVFKYTEMHGGSVQVESELGKGSRFTIQLPIGLDGSNISNRTEPERSVDSETQAEEEITKIQDISSHKSILLAEDNEASIVAVGDYLEELGYQVIVARNGYEAVELAETVGPDIILMDIQMPIMDGLEAIGILRKNPRFTTTPVIALTALAMPGDRERCLKAGANEYMSKPVSLKGLTSTIWNLLQDKKPE
jgi:CheY-like chemotaxis protein